MRAALLVALMFLVLHAPPAGADGIYLDTSLGWAQGLVQDVDVEKDVLVWSPWFHAQVEVGYEAGRWAVFAQHTSSPITSRDQGVDLIGVRFRIFGNKSYITH